MGIRSVIEKKNAACVKHGFIKAILVGGPILSGFTPAVREAVGLPVFDMVSLLNFFAKAQKRSGWNEGMSKDISKKLGVLTIFVTPIRMASLPRWCVCHT